MKNDDDSLIVILTKLVVLIPATAFVIMLIIGVIMS